MTQANISSISVQPPRRFRRSVWRFESPWEPISRIFIRFQTILKALGSRVFYCHTQFEAAAVLYQLLFKAFTLPYWFKLRVQTFKIKGSLGFGGQVVPASVSLP
jgi:hypothetical protein